MSPPVSLRTALSTPPPTPPPLAGTGPASTEELGAGSAWGACRHLSGPPVPG